MSSRHRDWDINCKVYIGNLGNNANKYELEDCFGKYGPLKNVWVARNPPGFAFVEFEDTRDAEDAVRGLDGTRVCGVSGLANTISSLLLLTLFIILPEPCPRRDVKRAEPRRQRRPRRRRTWRPIWRQRSRPRQEEEPLQVPQPRS